MKKNLLENIHRTITFNNIKINSNLMKENLNRHLLKMIWKYIQKMLNITCYEDMQINTAMIHPHTPSRVARIQEPVMPMLTRTWSSRNPGSLGQE